MKVRHFFENVILVMILLVVVQTFLDEYSVLMNWPNDWCRILLVTGFTFDVIFSIEFGVRAVVSLKNKRFLRYFLLERGWIDLLASIPLVLFVSGPALVASFFPHLIGAGSGALGVLNILKVVKAIRITRILRLLRVLKVFGKIQNTESVMAQRHIASIATQVVITIIVVLTAFRLHHYVIPTGIMPGHNFSQKQARKQAETLLRAAMDDSLEMGVSLRSRLARLRAEQFGILEVATQMGEGTSWQVLYQAPVMTDPEREAPRRKGRAVHMVESAENAPRYRLTINIHPFNASAARFKIIVLFIIIGTTLTLVFVYTRVFAQTISDPLFVMSRGVKEDDYNFEVKIREPYKDEEIFQLGKHYNEIWLPEKDMKLQQKQETEKTNSSALSMDDFLGAGGPDKPS